MTDDTKSIARGLKQRNPQLLDVLIEQYQFPAVPLSAAPDWQRERAEDFFQETWVRVLERGHQYDGKWKFEAWLFYDCAEFDSGTGTAARSPKALNRCAGRERTRQHSI